MQRINFSSKRARLALRFFTYGVMTVVTIVLTALAIFYAMGYRFNQFSFEQGGLVQFRSAPDGATVFIDGKAQSFKTPGRAHVPAGQHTIEMRMAGYHTWRKTVQLSAGQLLWLNYTRMVPLTVQTSPMRIFSAMHSALPSPDRRWIVLQETPHTPEFTLVDTSSDTPVFTTLRIPDAQLTRPPDAKGQFTIVEWDSGSRYVLVRHDVGGIREFIRLDRTRPEEPTNLNQRFGQPIDTAHFASSTANQVYARVEGVLRRFDLGATTVSAPLVHSVTFFSVSADGAITFVSEREATPGSVLQHVGMIKDSQESILRTFPLGQRILVDEATYFGHQYLAINAGDARVHILRDPTIDAKETTEFAIFDLDRPIDKLEFNNSGRMVMAASGGHVATYDIELGKAAHSILHDDNSPAGLPRWLDDYYLWTDVGGQLRIVEYDGQNGRDIAKVAPGFTAALTSNGKFLFSITKDPTTNTASLQVSRLTREE